VPSGEPPQQPVVPIDIVDTAAAGPAALRGGMVRTLTFGAGMLLSLASAPLLIRHLGDVDFGRYVSVLALIGIVAGLTEGGVTTIALRELSVTAQRAARNRLMGDLLGLRLALSGAGVGLAIAFTAIVSYQGDLLLGTALAGLGMIVMLTQLLVATVLQSTLRFGWAALIELARQAVNAGLIVALVLAGGGVLAFLAVGAVASLVGLVLTWMLVRGSISLRPAFHPRRWMPLVRETLLFAIATAVNTLYFRVTIVIMSLIATGAQTGYFSISFRVMEVLIGVPAMLFGAAFPIVVRSARDDRARFENAAARMFELGLLLGTLLTMCVALAAPFIIEIFTGSSGHPSAAVLQIQSIALVASFVATATGYPLLSLGRLRGILAANCLSLLLAACLALLLVPQHGAQGGAIAAVVADVALASANAVLLMRRGGPPLPLSALAVTAAAALVGYAAGRLAGVHPLVETAVAAIAFLVVLGLLRRFPPELRDLLRGRSATPGADGGPPVG
jgi:O-antigen/teichoic acid export membrane protein